MGYACPVCGTPQSDDEHLANHLAFTALLRGGDHEAWLDDHVDDWRARDPASLAPAVVEAAPEADYPQVFEDTTGGSGHDHGGHDHGGHAGQNHAGGLEADPARRGGYGRGSLDAEAESVLEEARELTRRMRGDADAPADGDDESAREGETE